MPLGMVEGELLILGANFASDIILTLIQDAKSKGKTEITVAELELMALRFKTIRETETDKIKERLKAATTVTTGSGST